MSEGKYRITIGSAGNTQIGDHNRQNADATVGSDAIMSSIAALRSAIDQADKRISDANKADAVRHVDTLQDEAAKPPSERDPGAIRRAIDGVVEAMGVLTPIVTLATNLKGLFGL